MSTQAQIDANRRNAQHSTGPRTEEGKAKSSRNATRFGLFTTNACIMPGEEEAWEEMREILWAELAPVGGLEEVTAGEYIRATWRLRRCAIAEEQLTERVIADQARKDKYSYSGDYTAPSDPILSSQRDTLAIARACTQAQNAQKRALAELRKLQADRRARATQIEAQSAPAKPEPAPSRDAIAEPTRPEPVPQPCPCGSTVEFGQCCGLDVLFEPPLRRAA